VQWGIVIGAALGALVGEGVALFVLESLQWTQFFDCLLLNLFIIVLYCLPGLGLGILLASFINHLKPHILIREEREPPLLIALWVFVALNVYAHLLSPLSSVGVPYERNGFVESFYGMLFWTAAKVILVGLIATAAAWLTSIGVQLGWPRRRSPRWRKKHAGWGWIVAVIAGPLLLIVVWVHNLTKLPERLDAPVLKVAGLSSPVLMIGWDGATWDVIDPLLEQGKMPHLKQLIDRGYRAPLQTIKPGLSALIWPEIFTGKPPAQHGLQAFTAYHIPLIGKAFQPPPQRTGLATILRVLARLHLVQARPTSALDRRVATVWELASEAGLKVGIMDGYTTFPAREVKGYLVSSHAYPRLRLAVSGDSPDVLEEAYEVYPPELLVGLEKEYQETASPSPDLLRRLADLNEQDVEQLPELDRMIRGRPLSYLKAVVAHDLFRLRAGRRLWQQYQPDFSFYFLNGVDGLQHYTWRYREPEKSFRVSSAQVKKYGQSIDLYYQWLDEQLAGLVQDASEQVNIVLLSDHGHGPVFLGSKGKSGDHGWGPDGILVLAGPQIRSGASTKNGSPPPHVRDIAPTVLYLLGLPVAEDLSGRILSEAIRPERLQGSPPQRVARYGPPPTLTKPRKSDSVDQEILERLRALGYL